jgi:redox-sensitive bicupin YhaK (pirin superfamily)
VRLYSGTSGGYRSPTRNHVAVTLADITIGPGGSFEQDLPSSYNGFAYVLSGSARMGADGTFVAGGHVGWLDRPGGQEPSLLRIAAGDEGVRLVLYAGEPQNVPISSGGPFIGDSREDIARLYSEYRQGQFVRMSELARHGGRAQS